MNEFEKYHFDLEGYILVKGLLTNAEAAQYLSVAQRLEATLMADWADAPSVKGHYGIEYKTAEDLGVLYYESLSGGGRQLIVDDFLNASAVFDALVAHESTMQYVRHLALGPYRLTSSELRIRYKSNKTLTHMGGPIDPRNRYDFAGRHILDSATGTREMRAFNLLTVRVIYALHDIPIENGPFCVVPGSHKANFFSPYGDDPSAEPGMNGVAMEAGDALFFTENLRHGGLPNLRETPRRTIHLTIGPRWAGSQSPAHWDGEVYVSPSAWGRYSEAQRAILPFPSALQSLEYVRLRMEEQDRLQAEKDALQRQLESLKGTQASKQKGLWPQWLNSLFGQS